MLKLVQTCPEFFSRSVLIPDFFFTDRCVVYASVPDINKMFLNEDSCCKRSKSFLKFVAKIKTSILILNRSRIPQLD